MFFSRRLGTFLWLPAIFVLVLNTSQDVIVLPAHSSLSAVFGALDLNLSAVMNQSEQNDASIHCETGVGRQYGSPQFMSCVDALEDIPKSTDFQSFGNRGTEGQGANKLPQRFISCKLHVYPSLLYRIPASTSQI